MCCTWAPVKYVRACPWKIVKAQFMFMVHVRGYCAIGSVYIFVCCMYVYVCIGIMLCMYVYVCACMCDVLCMNPLAPQAKKLVEGVPQVIKKDVNKEEAEKLRGALETAGGVVEFE